MAREFDYGSTVKRLADELCDPGQSDTGDSFRYMQELVANGYDIEIRVHAGVATDGPGVLRVFKGGELIARSAEQKSDG